MTEPLFEQLALYDEERARGILHHPDWVERMNQIRKIQMSDLGPAELRLALKGVPFFIAGIGLATIERIAE